MKSHVRAYVLASLVCSTPCLAKRARADAAPGDPSCAAPAPIHFRRGATSATVGGTVERAEYACYTLDACAGQRLDVQVRSAERNVVLIAYEPGYAITRDADGPDVSGPTLAGAGGQDEAMGVHGRLDRSGTYLFLLGSTRGAGGTYTLRATVR